MIWSLLPPQPCYCKISVVPRAQKWFGDANGESGLRVAKLTEHPAGGVRKAPARQGWTTMQGEGYAREQELDNLPQYLRFMQVGEMKEARWHDISNKHEKL